MKNLRIALSFLTTLPLPHPPAEAFLSGLGRAFAWYPAVGLLLGLLLTGASWLLGQTNLSLAVQAGLLLLAWTLLTGGLHLDGVMDSCDALFAPVSVERRLVILKDVHAGAFGVIGLFFVLGLKWALLASLLGQSSGWLALLLAPVWGRWMLVWAAHRFPYARRDESLGRTMTAGLSRRELLLATFFALAVQAGLGVSNLWLFSGLLALPLGHLLAVWAAGKLGDGLTGGLTGDLYGFLCEATEVLVLLLLALLGTANFV
jgi:adenosylcobinamide-GDP ribazoletransferase